MSSLLAIVTNISLAGLGCVSVFHLTRHRNIRGFIFQLFLIGLGFVFLYNFFPTAKGVVAKGAKNEIYFLIILYLFMILGMLANYAYTRFSKSGGTGEKFDLGTFIAPVFASPIVFLPLMAAFQSANIDFENLTTAKMMLFLVAFQNGFFWKEYFDNIQKDRKHGTDAQETK